MRKNMGLSLCQYGYLTSIKLRVQWAVAVLVPLVDRVGIAVQSYQYSDIHFLTFVADSNNLQLHSDFSLPLPPRDVVQGAFPARRYWGPCPPKALLHTRGALQGTGVLYFRPWRQQLVCLLVLWRCRWVGGDFAPSLPLPPLRPSPPPSPPSSSSSRFPRPFISDVRPPPYPLPLCSPPSPPLTTPLYMQQVFDIPQAGQHQPAAGHAGLKAL